MIAITTIASFRYASQNDGSRKCTTASAESCSRRCPIAAPCRQSTCSVVGMISGAFRRSGLTPVSCAMTIRPACRPMSSKLGMTPPTTPVPMNVSTGPYTGAVARRRDQCGAVARGEQPSFGILKIAGGEHHIVRTERAHALEHLRGRQRREILHLHVARDGRDLATQACFARTVPLRITGHDHESPGRWMPAQRERDGARVVVLDGDADHPGRQRWQVLQQSLGDGRVHHRDTRKR